MGLITKTVMILTMTVAAAPSYSMVYMWTDTAGIRHYTNKVYEIPARYRARVKSLYPESGDSGETLLQAEESSKAVSAAAVPEKARRAEAPSHAKKKVPINTMTKQPVTRVIHGKNWKPEPADE